MSSGVEAPLLVVAGVHNETSLGWSAAEAWLARDPANKVIATVRSEASQKFIEGRRQELGKHRLSSLELDWTAPNAVKDLGDLLNKETDGERVIAGVVHSIANADQDNFTTPAHELDAAIYKGAFDATTLTLVGLVRASHEHLAPSAGVVTYGFSEYGRVVSEYGPALSIAKVALSQLVKELAVSLGRTEPNARTAEIVTGFVSTYAGRGVLAGAGRKRGRRIRPEEMDEHVAKAAALSTANPEEQRRNAGLMAVSFIDDDVWQQTTGVRIPINAGWEIGAKPIIPEARLQILE